MTVTSTDVIIVGAGLSGIGAACQLQQDCPGKSYIILENRPSMGGTWDLFRYPGVRSDSDMHTLGYHFKPWRGGKALADGTSIRRYVEETAEENDISRHIRFDHRVTGASWDSGEGRWTVSATDNTSGKALQFSCRFLLMCSGYYNYEKAHAPVFENQEAFEGDLVYPQFWPRDLDYSGKKVVVIGSGATAVTLVPSMAETAAHVTMLQRSPTYIFSWPALDRLYNGLRKILPDRWAYGFTRWRNTNRQQRIYKLTRTRPEKATERILRPARESLGAEYVAEHFTPSYKPWDQRLCLIPDNDLFDAISDGRASVVTDHIDHFTKDGIALASGEHLDADIIVSATGLELRLLGGVGFKVDGRPVDFHQCWTYRGLMYSDVPNMVNTFGYINASWTLRADLIAQYTCRLLNEMDATGNEVVVPRLREQDRDMTPHPWIEDFSSGYMNRGMHLFPRQGDREPWTNTQDYLLERKRLLKGPLHDGALQFERAGAMPAADAA